MKPASKWEVFWMSLQNKRLYLKIELDGLQGEAFGMWFKVVGKDGESYVVENPNHYDTVPEKGKSALIYPDDPRILESKWQTTDDSLLTPPAGYLRLKQAADTQHYYPSAFDVVSHGNLGGMPTKVYVAR